MDTRLIPLGRCPVCSHQLYVGKQFCGGCGTQIDSNTPPYNTLAYFRPRGIEGNYLVGLYLELQPTATAEVFVSRYREKHYNCGRCGRQNPVFIEKRQKLKDEDDGSSPEVTEAQTARVEKYLIEEFIFKDKITVEIHDKYVVPFQTIVYTATKEGLTAKPKKCTIHHRDWGIISFHAIRLLDLDAASPSPGGIQVVPQEAAGKLPVTIPEQSASVTLAPTGQTLNRLEAEKATADMEIKAQPEQQLIAQWLILYPYLPETVMKEQVQRFTRPSGIVHEVRLHEELTKMNAAAKHANAQ